MLNPEDFIITRKRKKYKFAKFANSPICYEFDEWNYRPIDVIEIGAGNGLFSVEMAKRFPQSQFLALDVKGDRLQKGAYEATDQNINNIYFLRARADQLVNICHPKSIESIWITFPDPFLRRRSSGRRLTNSYFLKIYQQILNSNGALYLKHDNRDFFCWSLEQLVINRWRIEELSIDLQESNLVDSYKIKTTYETRWLEDGLTINFVKALPPLS